MSVDARTAALEVCFVPSNAGELRASSDLEEGSLRITRGSPREPDAVIETDPGGGGLAQLLV
jgi:hypothetical protein